MKGFKRLKFFKLIGFFSNLFHFKADQELFLISLSGTFLDFYFLKQEILEKISVNKRLSVIDLRYFTYLSNHSMLKLKHFLIHLPEGKLNSSQI